MNIKRIAEPIVLGVLANILINIFLHPGKPHFRAGEFVIAILLAIPITEMNRFINFRLEQKYSWSKNYRIRFLLHFLYLAIALIFCLNVFGNLFLWITNAGSFSRSDLLIINLVTILVAFLLTIFNWAVYFYQRWRFAESAAQNVATEMTRLKSTLNKVKDVIELQKGTTKFRVEASEIRLAVHNASFVKVYLENADQGIFNGTISELEDKLPGHLFFRASRNTIVHRDIIASVAPAAYGKLQVALKSVNVKNADVVISRLKAASFRQWYDSSLM